MSTIELEIDGQELAFEVDADRYHRYLNELTPDNKIRPSHNFCMRCVVQDDRDALRKLLEKPGAALQIAGTLIEEFAPVLEIAVKKPGAAKSSTSKNTSGS